MVAEDNLADVFLIRESIAAAQLDAHIQVLPDGEQAAQYFAELERDPAKPCPDLIVLDLNLPRRPGNEVLRQIRSARRCARTPVLIVTSSNSEEDRLEMTQLGASGYFTKPSDFGEFMKLGEYVKHLLARTPSGQDAGNEKAPQGGAPDKDIN